jgi:threonine/homoserine/homoserine lactone efflux protein
MRIFALSFVTGLSGAMMPGPLVALTIGQVAASGFMAAIWLITGHALLELVVLVLLVLGLRVILARPKVRGGIGLIGGAALLYMGVDMVRHAAAVQIIGEGSATPMSVPYLLLAGAAVSLANPYFTGWWATIGVGQLAQTGPQTRGQYVAFYVAHELSDYVWYAFVAVLIVGARQWLTGSWYNWLVGLSGVAVAALALWFLYHGIKLLGPRRGEAPASPEL